MRTLISSGGRAFAVAVVFATALTGQGVLASGATATATDRSDTAADEGVASAQLPSDPGSPGALPSVTEDYELDPVRIAPLPTPVEMIGHVVRPEVPDPSSPLVLFLHGAHEACYAAENPTGSGQANWPCPEGTSPVPSHLGYDYLQRLLASQGYVTVSISANGVNAQALHVIDDLGADARGTLVRRHLARWAGWDADGRYAVDMRNVVVIGHSRGGEGVNRATVTTPLSAPYEITGQVLIAPTNSERSTASYVPTVVLLPYCDGDVRSLEGQRFVDLGRDLASDDSALRSAALILGANHNFFNTEWTPRLAAAPAGDDWGGDPDAPCGKRTTDRLSASEQRDVARAYVGGAVALMARADSSMLPLFDGTRDAEPASAGDATVLTHLIGAGRVLRRAGLGMTVAPDSTAEAFLCAGRAKPGVEAMLTRLARPDCGRDSQAGVAPHWPASTVQAAPTSPAVEIAWSAAGQFAGLQLTRPLDLAASPALDIRTIVDPHRGDIRLRLRLHDTAGGNSGWLAPAGGTLLPTLPRGEAPLSKRWAQTLRLPSAGVTGVDLGAVTRIDMKGISSDGRVWVLDLAATMTAVPAVPDRRLPVLSLDNVRVQEGDRPSTRMAAVPYTVTGTLDRAASVAIQVSDPMSGQFGRSLTLDIPAGSASGVVKVPYPADSVDDLRRSQLALTAYAVRNIAVRDGHALVWILDDDPAPTVTVTRVDDLVREGASARWRVTLSAPVDYELMFTPRVVRGNSMLPKVRVGDVARAFRLERVDPSADLAAPLHSVETYLSLQLSKGMTTGVLAIPMRPDGQREGREAITVEMSSEQILFTPRARTIVVRDR